MNSLPNNSDDLRVDLNSSKIYLSMIPNESIIFAFIYGLIFLFGILSNFMVILIYLSNNILKNHTNYFFANLSLSDIMVLAVCTPITIADLIFDGEWVFGYFYCKLNSNLNYFWSSNILL